jgi:hypothetical protein
LLPLLLLGGAKLGLFKMAFKFALVIPVKFRLRLARAEPIAFNLPLAVFDREPTPA